MTTTKTIRYVPVLADDSPCIIIIDTINAFFTWYFASLSELNTTLGRRSKVPMLKKKMPELEEVFEMHFRRSIRKILSLEQGSSVRDIIFATDCLRHQVWRNDYLRDKRQPLKSVYKATRKTWNDNGIPRLMRFLFDNLLPRVLPNRRVGAPRAEADDVIAVITRLVNARAPNRRVIIISDDSDFIQLLDYPLNDLYNQRFRRVRSHMIHRPRDYTHIKVICGDRIDNISASFPRCGKKTAERFVTRPHLLERNLKRYGREIYDRNRLLIDFDFIPQEIKGRIIEKALCIRHIVPVSSLSNSPVVSSHNKKCDSEGISHIRDS